MAYEGDPGNMGFTQRLLKDYLGHRDIRSTRRYVRAAKQRYGSIQSIGLIGPDAGGDAKSETGTEGDR